jgi:tRNA-(ms[2]io[6]A)-hydroxylase
MLGLQSETDPAWALAAERDVAALLADHAHCELKAAQSALSIVGRHAGEHPRIVAPLLALAREETLHFDAVLARMTARGERLGPPPVDAFVVALRDAAKPDASAVPRLLDRLLVSALIEARSCERFRILAERLGDADLRAFYRELMASEARHYTTFVDLGEDVFGKGAARARLDVLARREADVARTLGAAPAVHG